MAGLALGSWIGGRAIDRWPVSPLRAYAVLELLIALSASLIPWMVAPLESLKSGALFWTFLLLLLPTFFMGATLPVLTKLVAEDLDCLGARVGQIYSANTSGAVVGACAAGYLMVPLWGIARSLYIAVGLNLVVALVVFLLPKKETRVSGRETGTSQQTPWRTATLWAFGFSGMIALAFEVVWTRALSVVLGTSVYAFSTMLVIFLVGIAAGSALMGTRADRVSRPEVVFGTLLAGTGLAGLWGVCGLPWLPKILFWAGPHLSGFGSYLGLHLLLAAIVLLPQTLFLGATLPIVTRLVTPSIDRVGTQMGQAYFFNTCGAILGSLIAGFGLVPWLGPNLGAFCLALVGLLVGIAWLGWTGARKTAVLALLLALPLGLGWRGPDPKDQIFAAYSVPSTLAKFTYQESRTQAEKSEVLFFEHGLHSSVAVFKTGDLLALSLDGWVVASTSPGDRFIEQALGYFPLLLTEQTESVLVVGLGTGITAASAASSSAESVQVAELEARVVTASEQFKPWNENLFLNPAVSVTVADGRRFLAQSRTDFDVITSDPIHPFSRGSASLYTVEHFQACRDNLKPGGVMVQWMPLYGLSRQDIQIVTQSFLRVFPNASLWCWYPSRGREDTLLLGFNGEPELDFARIQQRLDRLQASGVPWQKAEEVIAGYLMEGEALEQFAGGVVPNTDDRPILEFTAPISLYQRSEAGAQELARTLIEDSDTAVPSLDLNLAERASLVQEFGKIQRASKAERILHR